MPNGIFRAGPWSDGTSPNLNPETDFSDYPTKAPVNANNRDWTNTPWTWVWYNTIDGEDFDSAGTAGLDETVTQTGEIGAFQQNFNGDFYYQAAVDFDLTFHWDMGDGGDSFNLAYNGNEYYVSTDNAGSKTITLRAGALENVYFGLVAWGDSTISMRITAPIT